MADQLSDEFVLSLLKERIFKLNDSDVYNLARNIKEPQLTNVINGLEDQSFGLYQNQEESITKVGIFYIHSNKYNGLSGLFVDFEINEKFRDRFVFFFSQVLIREYPLMIPQKLGQ